MNDLPSHLHCVYLVGGLDLLLRRDFTRDWWDEWADFVKPLKDGRRPSQASGASVVFNDHYGHEFTRWFDGLADAEKHAFCQLGVAIIDLPAERLLKNQDDRMTLFVVDLASPHADRLRDAKPAKGKICFVRSEEAAMSWRDKYRPIIAAILERHEHQMTAACRRELRDAFPDPPRAHHPYKVWRHEISVQMGIKRFGKRKHPKPRGPAECAGQQRLF